MNAEAILLGYGAWRGTAALLLVALLAGCTPEHTVQTSKELAAHARLTDSVTVRRSNDRVLSRQAQICLVSDSTDTEIGRSLLRNMQSALSGYFLAVGLENEALDYTGALQHLPCPGANYILFVQLANAPCGSEMPACENGIVTELLITILNADNSGLTDRIALGFQRSWLSPARAAQTDQQAAFQQLGQMLTGVRKS